MTEPMSTGHRASINAHLAHVRETGQTMGDVYLRDAVDEVNRLRAQMAIVEAFLAERAEFVTTLRQCVEADGDYWRWQGHAEARRVLSERLGLPVGWPPEDAAKAARRAQQDGGENR